MMSRGTLVAVLVAGMVLSAEASAQTLGPPVPIAAPVPADTDGEQELLRIGGSAEHAIIVYNDFAGYGFDSRVAHIDRTSHVVTELDLRLSDPTAIACVGTVCVAPTTTYDFLAGTSESALVRFQVDGTLVGSTPVVVDDFAYVVAAGDHFLVLTNPRAGDVYSTTARTLSPTAPAASALGPIHEVLDANMHDAVTCGVDDCLVGSRRVDGYHLTRVGHDGALVSGDVIVAPPELSYVPPGIGAAGAEYRVGWYVNRDWYVIAPDDTVTMVPATFDPYTDRVVSASCMADGRCVYAGSYGTGLWESTGFTPLGPGTFVTCGTDSCLSVRVLDGTIEIMRAEDVEGVGFFVGVGELLSVGATLAPQNGFLAVGESMAAFHRRVDGQYVPMAVRLDENGAPTGAPWALGDSMGEIVPIYVTSAGENVAFAFLQRLEVYDAAGNAVGSRYLEDCARVTSVAFNGTHILATCRGEWDRTMPGRMTTRRYDTVGQLVDTTSGTLGMNAQEAVLVADESTGGWTAYIDTGRSIRRLAIAADGTPAATDSLVRDADVTSLRAGRGATGDHLVWLEGFPVGTTVRAAVVADDATVVPIAGRVIATATVEYDYFPFVTIGGRSNSLVAWSHPDHRVELRAIDATASPEGELIEVTPATRTRGRVWWTYDVALGPRSIAYEAVPTTGVVLDVRVRTLTELAGPGETCAAPGDCGSGFCVAGVCCDRACDGGCEACATGTCAVREAGAMCRAAVDECDTAEVCDGTATSCPAPAGEACSDSGVPDGGPVPDAPMGVGADAGGGGGGGGCAVTSARGPSHLWLASIGVLLAVVGRRRAQRRAPTSSR